MFGELQTIENEKNYLMDRLTRTTKEVLGKKKKKRSKIDPMKEKQFKRSNKTFTNNQSLLVEEGMLTINNHALAQTTKSSKVRSLSQAGDCWDKPNTGMPSFHKRNSILRNRTIYGSGQYEMNLSATVGNICPKD